MQVNAAGRVFASSLIVALSGCEPVECRGEDCPCISTADCRDRPECSTDPVCLGCEQGGDCSFTGVLTILGEVKSGTAVVSGVKVVARCETSEATTQPDELGAFTVELDVSDCDNLTVAFDRESYVPVIRTLPMPPPVSHVEMKVNLFRGIEVLCGNDECASEDNGSIFTSPNTGEFARGWVFNSDDLDAVASIGSGFESESGELLLLHGFAFRHWYDQDGNSVPMLTRAWKSCGRIDGKQLDWISDLYVNDNIYDYHLFMNSDTYLVDFKERGWFETVQAAEDAYREHIDEFEDSAIDPDANGYFDGIEMAAYNLDLHSGRWVKQEQNTTIEAIAEREFRAYADTVSMLGLLPVPSLYLPDIQAGVSFGPGAFEKANEPGADGGGVYGAVSACVPTPGSGIYAYGQPMSKTCLRILVVDQCEEPVAGAQVVVTGDDHGYRAEDLSDTNGVSCVHVARTEAIGTNLDSDTLFGEKYNVNVQVTPPVGFSGGRTAKIATIETSVGEGDCTNPLVCDDVVIKISARPCEAK